MKDVTLSELFTEIATAIRNRTGNTHPITARDMSSAIETMETDIGVKIYPTVEDMNSDVPPLGTISLVYDKNTNAHGGMYEFKEVENTTEIRVPLIDGSGFHPMKLNKDKLYSVLEKARANFVSNNLKVGTYLLWWIGEDGVVYAGRTGSDDAPNFGTIHDTNGTILGIGNCLGKNGTWSQHSIAYQAVYPDTNTIQSYNSSRKYTCSQSIDRYDASGTKMTHNYTNEFTPATVIMRAKVTSDASAIDTSFVQDQYVSLNPTYATTIFEPFGTEIKHERIPLSKEEVVSLPSLTEGAAPYTINKEKLYRTIENVLDNPTADAVKSNYLMVFITTSNKCCVLDTAKCANAGIVYRYDDHEEVHVGITELTSSAEQPAYIIYELDLENETLGSVLSEGKMSFRDRYNAQGMTAGYHSWVTDSKATPITMGVRLKYVAHNVSEDELTNTLYYADSPERTQVMHDVIVNV